MVRRSHTYLRLISKLPYFQLRKVKNLTVLWFGLKGSMLVVHVVSALTITAGVCVGDLCKRPRPLQTKFLRHLRG